MCERCEISPHESHEREIPEYPIEVLHDKLVIYPDLLELGKTYEIKYQGAKYLIAKTDLGVISVMKE